MNEQLLVRDERTVAVENASYRLGYLVLSFGLLLIVAYRGYALQESNWDLMALVILGGLATTFYQGMHRILSLRWASLALGIMVAAAVIAGAIALLR